MSYDVILEKEMVDVKTGETESKTVGSFNHTSNLYQFFRYFFDGDLGLFELNGLYGDEVKLTIDKFYDNFKENKLFWEKCKLYNTPNGWGSIVSALMFLDDIREVAVKNPSAVCLVSC